MGVSSPRMSIAAGNTIHDEAQKRRDTCWQADCNVHWVFQSLSLMLTVEKIEAYKFIDCAQRQKATYDECDAVHYIWQPATKYQFNGRLFCVSTWCLLFNYMSSQFDFKRRIYAVDVTVNSYVNCAWSHWYLCWLSYETCWRVTFYVTNLSLDIFQHWYWSER
jgi:hypothetical protein